MGGEYSVVNVDIDMDMDCGVGISFVMFDWCMVVWCDGYCILIVEFMVQDIVVIFIVIDGKFRVYCCCIVGEKNVNEFGLVKVEKL